MAPPLEIYLLTFNCAQNLIDPNSVAPTFFRGLPKNRPIPDLISIALQEVAPLSHSFLGGAYLDPYLSRISSTVEKAVQTRFPGDVPPYQLVESRNVGLTGLLVYARPEVVDRISWVQTAGTGVGLWNMGNKGAVGIRLGVVTDTNEEQAITFISAHLAPMEDGLKRRNQDWETIVRTLVFLDDRKPSRRSEDEEPLLSTNERVSDLSGIYAPGTHVFFAGDLNYRTSDMPPNANTHLQYPQPSDSRDSSSHWENLLSQDQLTRELQAGRTLHGFQEAAISFPPTYKYSFQRPNSVLDPIDGVYLETIDSPRMGGQQLTRWPWAKHRFPSWCDRILFLPATDPKYIQTHMYTSLPLPPSSDHQPVALSVSIEDDSSVRRDSNDELHTIPPFPIDGDWKARREAAERRETIVGALAYLAMTKEGNLILTALAGGVIGSWFLFRVFSTL